MYEISELVEAYLAGERAGYQVGVRDTTDFYESFAQPAQSGFTGFPADNPNKSDDACNDPYDPWSCTNGCGPAEGCSSCSKTDEATAISDLEERVSDVEEATHLITTYYLGVSR